MSHGQQKDDGGGCFAWVIAGLIALAILIYSVSGIGNLLDLTPTGSEVLDEEYGYVTARYEGVVVGYILTVLIMAFVIGSFFLWRWIRTNQPEDESDVLKGLVGFAVLLAALVIVLPVGARETPLDVEGDRAGASGRSSGPSPAELRERREERRQAAEKRARERRQEEQLADRRRERREEARQQAAAAIPEPAPAEPAAPSYANCDSAPSNIPVPPGSDLDADGDGIGCEE